VEITKSSVELVVIFTRGTFHTGGVKNHGGEDVGPNTLRQIEELCYAAMEFVGRSLV
jgi:hypothetical protein